MFKIKWSIYLAVTLAAVFAAVLTPIRARGDYLQEPMPAQVESTAPAKRLPTLPTASHPRRHYL